MLLLYLNPPFHHLRTRSKKKRERDLALCFPQPPPFFPLSFSFPTHTKETNEQKGLTKRLLFRCSLLVLCSGTWREGGGKGGGDETSYAGKDKAWKKFMVLGIVGTQLRGKRKAKKTEATSHRLSSLFCGDGEESTQNHRNGFLSSRSLPANQSINQSLTHYHHHHHHHHHEQSHLYPLASLSIFPETLA